MVQKKAPEWTKEQLQAITAEGSDLLVAAAAGSGKTAVLVERIIRKITRADNPIDIDKILVVTFTKAAANEMRERVREALYQLMMTVENPKSIYRQMVLLNKAYITTIDSFCTDVLRTYFDRVDLDPAFRVADETEVELLRAEALTEVLDLCYADATDTDFVKLTDAYGFGGAKDDSRLESLILNLYN